MNRIEEYDQGLKQDISSLRKYIRKDEELGKRFMRDMGTSGEEIEKIASSWRSEGTRISSDPPTLYADRLLEHMKGLLESTEFFAFRIYLYNERLSAIRPYPGQWRWGDWLSIQIMTEDDWFWFDTCVLAQDERTEFVKHMSVLFIIYLQPPPGHVIIHCYPSLELMKFVGRMLMKYKSEEVLTKAPRRDQKAWTLWSEVTESEEHRQEIERLSPFRLKEKERGSPFG